MDREQINNKAREYYAKTKERRRFLAKGYYRNHRQKRIASAGKYRLEHMEQHRLSGRQYYKRNKSKVLQYTKGYILKHKIEMLTYYGNGILSCVKCGYNDMRALTIDHINGLGGIHRKGLRKNIYVWLKKQNFPEGYQTLCMNCQFIKKVDNHETR